MLYNSHKEKGQHIFVEDQLVNSCFSTWQEFNYSRVLYIYICQALAFQSKLLNLNLISVHYLEIKSLIDIVPIDAKKFSNQINLEVWFM